MFALGAVRPSCRSRPGVPRARRCVPAPALAQRRELPGLLSQQGKGRGRRHGAASGGAGVRRARERA
eukprot:6510283-Lingulodinium_polyedra.AAC.1